PETKWMATLHEKKIKTLKAAYIIESSIEQDQIVYDTPRTILLRADKALDSVKATLSVVGGEDSTVLLPTSVKESMVEVKIDELERQQEYLLRVTSLRAVDGSSL